MSGIKTAEEEGAPLLRASVSAHCLSTSVRYLGHARRITGFCVRACTTRGLHVIGGCGLNKPATCCNWTIITEVNTGGRSRILLNEQIRTKTPLFLHLIRKLQIAWLSSGL